MNTNSSNRTIRAIAKDRMQGFYGPFIACLIIMGLITTAVINVCAGVFVVPALFSFFNKSFATLTSLISLVLGLAFTLVMSVVVSTLSSGICYISLKAACRQQILVADLFQGFRNDAKKTILVGLGMILPSFLFSIPGSVLTNLSTIFTSCSKLLSVLGGVLAVIGIIGSLYFSFGLCLSYFVMFDYPGLTPREVLEQCWNKMEGHRMRLFLMLLGYFPLALLCLLTCGIGMLWLYPLMSVSQAVFYLDLMNPGSMESAK